ncbi:hypothetical protein [Nocardioides sp. YIM 152588]|uniref:hypothetical protein n=1 Tax=Nocardioides sp. YIM 152588 TaxID=3158259 RepID=UPI0032E502B2
MHASEAREALPVTGAVGGALTPVRVHQPVGIVDVFEPDDVAEFVIDDGLGGREIVRAEDA